MRLYDPLLFLFGDRGAIERIAATRHVWLVGAILVLSAGIARNYDHLDLLRDPDWITGPFAASLFTSCFVFAWIAGPLRLMKAGPYWRQQGVFLSLVWITAPCAWIYGVPVEAFTDIVTATKWNIAFLAVVSFWRVAIMVRAVSVLAEVSWKRVLPLLLAPAALEAMVGSWFRSLSLVGIMGGVRLPPHTELLVSATDFTASASFWVFLACLALSVIVKGKAARSLSRKNSPASSRVAGVAALCLLLWIAASLPIQPKVANRHRLQTLFDERDFSAAIAFASEKGRGGFLKYHYLPPLPEHFPLDLLDKLPADTPGWLREEWEGNAIESLKIDFDLDGKEWNVFSLNHPAVADAIHAHAGRLRNPGTQSGSKEKHWLHFYNEAEKERERLQENFHRFIAPTKPAGSPPR